MITKERTCLYHKNHFQIVILASVRIMQIYEADNFLSTGCRVASRSFSSFLYLKLFWALEENVYFCRIEQKAAMKQSEMSQKRYLAIDLKSFYASVECVERGLDPLTTNLVVADKSRTEKTICLAVSPSLKAYGIGGRARLFEVVQRVKEVNYERRTKAGGRFSGKSFIVI